MNLNKKSIKGQYRHFIYHLKKWEIFPELSRPCYVGVSGGIDSMTLASLLLLLREDNYIKDLTFLHFNHCTRQKSDYESEFIKALAQKFNIKFITKNAFDLSLNDSNFEAKARSLRNKFFKESISSDGLLFLGHHIDDSFEWHLMQSMRSSELISSLGIPLKNGCIRRPLMCFTKKQIVDIARLLEIQYLEDESNLENRFMRNYYRNLVIPHIARRNPSYLKHYVARANELAKLYEGQISEKKLEKKIDKIHLDLTSLNITAEQQLEIKASIKRLSSKKRGTISYELSKLIKAIANGKNGPFSFSGGVKVIRQKKRLTIYSQTAYEQIGAQG